MIEKAPTAEDRAIYYDAVTQDNENRALVAAAMAHASYDEMFKTPARLPEVAGLCKNEGFSTVDTVVKLVTNRINNSGS